MKVNHKRVILGVTGSIAAYKAPDIVRHLMRQDYLVSVIMTETAVRFISPLTLASVSRQNVHRDMFDEKQKDWRTDHVSLAQEAAAVVIAPATADVIGRIACGLADDLLTCTVMATRAPVFIAPAMNEGMYRNPIVQENIRKLKKLGIRFIGPEKGPLACGSEGEGRMTDPQKIAKEIKRFLK